MDCHRHQILFCFNEKLDYIEEATCDFESIDLKKNVLKILVQNWYMYNLPNIDYGKPPDRGI